MSEPVDWTVLLEIVGDMLRVKRFNRRRRMSRRELQLYASSGLLRAA